MCCLCMKANKTISNINWVIFLKSLKFSLLVGLCNASGELLSNGGYNKLTWFFSGSLRHYLFFSEIFSGY